ncbi:MULTISPECIES: M3 family oligoendopeptidase [unclassified Acidiphilium]|jgi:oligoendopeptidase F|uniref:M3 family oligoendopeptidase n=1 Tax=unclassified Acidiphilium TaxID=2617493 RepID=UPI000BD089F8|nr:MULTISPECIES: M3 family oligoendopeptidase [unclassified Acidiphilium]OYV56704.1 MAG: oligoendopeptidase F [Acidiphilium sp. 20-67-58]HQT60851.1 M3 family oligoendopeptidase [Acidiphilium sp.]
MTLTRPLALPDDMAGVTVRPEAGNDAAFALPSWTLTDLYRGTEDQAIEADLARLEADAIAFAAALRGTVAGLDGAALAAAIARYEAIEQGLGRLHTFAQLNFSADATVPTAGPFYQSIAERATAIGGNLVFFPIEINLIDDTALEAALADPALARYAPWLRDLRALRPHQLSGEIERLLLEKEVTGHAAWSRLFDETTAALRVPVAGEDLTLSAALNRLSDTDRARREAAGRAIGGTLQRNSRLFAQILNTIAKDKAIEDGWRRYPTPEAARHLANRVEPEVVEALVTAVTQAYPRLAHRYYTLKAGWLGLERLQHWDRNAPLPGEPDRRISWSEARETVLGAYGAFSPEMRAVAARFFDGGWIDAVPRPGKSGGAFAHPAVPDVHPYVLLNYHGRTRDVMTLAHELGHGVHQVLAARQGYLMASTPLTLAETASVFGEMLTFRALLDAETDPQRRRLMLAQKVEDMLNTVVRQIAFHQFEQRLHAARRRGELLPDEISAIWLAVQRESLGPAFEFSDEYRMFWAYVPHFVHSPFYVYAYAFGDCLVNALYGVYHDAAARGEAAGFVNRYLDMLAAGGTRRHREVLAPFGLDASDPAFWRRGLDVIAGFIDELEH